jgi:hypothetical protein
LQAATPPAATPRTITRKPFETLDGHSGMPPEVPDLSKPTAWITNRLPSSQHVWRIRFQSFTGLSSASFGASIVKRTIGQACRLTVLMQATQS